MKEETRRILIVDDTESDRIATRFLLERKRNPRYVIQEVNRGDLAIAACERFQPDCVLMDFRLPDEHGLTVLAQLKRKFGALKFAVVLITGSGHELLAVRALKSGAQDYIPKSHLTEDMLERAILNALDKLTLEQQKKEAEDALAANEGKFRQIVSATPCAMYTIDMVEGRSLYVSSFAEELTGYTTEEMDNLGAAGLLALVHPEDRATVQSHAKKLRLAADGEVLDCEFRMMHRDKNWKWLSLRGHVVMRDANGLASMIAGAASDVSQHLQLEDELRESRMQLIVANEAAGFATWSWDLGAEKLICSPLLLELYGRSGEQALSRNIWGEWVHPDDRPRAAADVANGWAGETFETEFRIVWPDGSIHWLRSRGKLLKDSKRPLRFYGANLDVSEEKKAEEELRRSNEDLERFAYVASHDLQEPLRTILSFSELLTRRNKDMDQESRQFLDYIRQGGHRMQALTADLLTFSRVTQAEQEPLERIDCGEVLAEALNALRVLIKESNAKIEWNDLPALTANFQQMMQLFQNLVGNAIKYRIDEQIPAVEVSAKKLEHAWQFCVADNGIGFEMQYADRIFEAFKRLHTREQFSGTGLGLAICKRIVERHGGRIWAESEVGTGSKFFFTISDQAGALL